MCKPNKANGAKHRLELGHTGFGKLRNLIRANTDLKEHQ